MRIIVPMIVGGIIGYITNWLAIKMLFRPYREIKVLGIKLPFTPGLIPKERNRIAKSIGETVGVNLLSPDVVTNALSSPEMNENINRWIKDNLYKLRENHNTINSILMMQGHEKNQEIINYLNEKITNSIFSKINKKEFKDNIVDFAEDILYNKYGAQVQGLMLEQINMIVTDLLNSEGLKNEIESGIQSILAKIKDDDRTLYEALPESIINSIENYIDKEQDAIVAGIVDIIKGPEIQDKLKSALAEIVNQNVNKVITMFITPEQISEKLLLSIEKYIDSPEVDGTIIYIVKNSIDKILSHKVQDIGQDALNIVSNGEGIIFSDLVMAYISNEHKQEKLLSFIKEKLETENMIIKTKVLDIISNGIDYILNLPEFHENLGDIVNQTLVHILNQPISSLFNDLSMNNVDSITESLNVGFHSLVNTHLPDIITSMNISSIVEQQINSFDVEYTEELILDIAKKELSAITWVGALLGIIIGLSTPLLQMLY